MSIPGVGLDERRRMTACHQRIKIRQVSTTSNITGFHHTELDPVAFEARNRLGQRLGYRRDGGVGKIWGTSRRFGFMKDVIFKKLWCYRSTGCEQICAICLDKCDGDVETTVLKCLHKYHSNCVLPWLEAHSNCPYCRSPV